MSAKLLREWAALLMTTVDTKHKSIAVIDSYVRDNSELLSALWEKGTLILSDSMQDMLKDLQRQEITEAPSLIIVNLESILADATTEKKKNIDETLKHWVFTYREALKKFQPKENMGSSFFPAFLLTCENSQTEKFLKATYHTSLFNILTRSMPTEDFLHWIDFFVDPTTTSQKEKFLKTSETSIEMSKESPLFSFSESGITILSPYVISEGSCARFRLFLTNEKAPFLFVGRAATSELEVSTKQYKVQFNYFGLSQQQLKTLRLFFNSPFTKKKSRLSIIESKDDKPKDSENENPKNQNIVMIDMDHDSLNLVSQVVEQYFPQHRIHTYSTFKHFEDQEIQPRLKKLQGLEDGDEKKVSAPARAGEWLVSAFSFGPSMTLMIDPESEELVKIEPQPRMSDRICDYTANQITRSPHFWRELFHEDHKKDLNDLLAYARSGQRASMSYKLVNKNKAWRWFEIIALPANAENLIEIVIKDQSDKNQVSRAKKKEQQELPQVDMLIINGCNIDSQSVNTWLEKTHQTLLKAGLLPNKKVIPTTLVAGEASTLRPVNYCKRGISDFISKPLDRRLLVQKLIPRLAPEDLELSLQFSADYTYSSPIQVGRPIELEGINRFGLVVKNNKPIHPGVLTVFHSPLLTNKRGHGTLARSHFFEPHPDQPGQYRLYFLFYGMTEERQKEIEAALNS